MSMDLMLTQGYQNPEFAKVGNVGSKEKDY